MGQHYYGITDADAVRDPYVGLRTALAAGKDNGASQGRRDRQGGSVVEDGCKANPGRIPENRLKSPTDS
jgi:hypothetical protein